MQNRSKKRWLDVQIILASIAVTFTVGLWNVFAKGNRPFVSPTTPSIPDPAFTLTYTPDPVASATATLDPYAPVHLPRLHLLLGGKQPVAPVFVAALLSGGDSSNQGGSSISQGGSTSSQASVQNNLQDNGAGTINPAPPPAPAPPPPVTNTSSSKP